MRHVVGEVLNGRYDGGVIVKGRNYLVMGRVPSGCIFRDDTYYLIELDRAPRNKRKFEAGESRVDDCLAHVGSVDIPFHLREARHLSELLGEVKGLERYVLGKDGK